MNSTQYEIRALKSFQKSLARFPEKSQKRIKNKIEEILTKNPYRYGILTGIYKYKGLSFTGMRKMKTGLEGHKGGVYILYRVCKECRENRYYIKSGLKCEFCEDGIDKRIVLFIAAPRSSGY